MRVSTRMMTGYYQMFLTSQTDDQDAGMTQAQLLIDKIKAAQASQNAENSADLPDSRNSDLRAVAAKYDPRAMTASDLTKAAKELYDAGAISQEDAYALLFKARRGASYEKADADGVVDWLKETEAEAKALKEIHSKNADSSERALTLLKRLDSARTTKSVNVNV